ncbi:MAG: PAS domain S-box protein [Ktedonobacteraceae bacterium]|nr:PAS domain S-box protein [Ktedonobacteraceae bacterium]MBO0789832.1 PAS domain S-box protein [Ktedonobacteraceae bacterium]
MASSNQNPQQANNSPFSPREATADARFLAVMQESADVFWILTPMGEMHDVSPSWHNFTGQRESDSRGRGWLDLFHPAEQPCVQETLIQTVASGRTHERTCSLRRYDGIYRLIHVRLIPVRKPPWAIAEIVACGRDITTQELARQMSEAQMQLAVKASGVGIWDWNLMTKYIECTDQMATQLGLFPQTSASYERFLACLYPDDRERVQHAHQRALAEKTEYHIEYRTIWPDGSTHWLIVSGHCIDDLHGKPIHLLGASMDITALKQAQEALWERESRWFRHIVKSNIVGIMLFDLEGTVLEANDAFLSLVGYTQEDIGAGRVQWTTMTPSEYRTQDAQAIEELCTTGMAQPTEKEYIAKDGKRVPVLTGATLLSRAGTPPLAISFVLDLTTRKEVERQKDIFLGMTSHELKTPLTALRGTLQLVQRRLKRIATTDGASPEWRAGVLTLKKHLENGIRQIDVQTRLINDLLDISRITAKTLKLSLQRCELGSIVRETVEDVRVTVPERSLVLDVPEDIAVHVLADRDRISQVVTNYVTNALRYSSPDHPVQVGLTVEEGMARVWVRDRGPGLSEEAQQEIWQCFHQVKDIPVQSGSGKGLGLGLYICQTLIAQHQGEVGVESAPGKGSTFWFTLPVVSSRESVP